MVTESDKTNTAVVATIVVVGAFAMISISALLTALVRSEETRMDAVRPTHADLDTIAALDTQQVGTLHAPVRWVDKSGRRIAIPIERAMQLVVADFHKDPSAASPPVPPGLVLPPTPPADGAAAAGLAAVPAGTVAAANPAPSAVSAAAPGAVSPAAPGVALPTHPALPSASPPSGAAPGSAPGPAAPANPPVPASRKL